jgi:CheY-like chemotaxis protein
MRAPPLPSFSVTVAGGLTAARTAQPSPIAALAAISLYFPSRLVIMCDADYLCRKPESEVATILVVDDSMFQRHALGRMLKEAGHSVLEAENGIAGLEKIESDRPDAVILDLIMPKLGGFETLEELRKRGNRTPVFVFTADIQATSRERCLELGATAFINKPLNREELKEALERLI